jgi:GMP synthase-like glutamine amidotransferase
MMPIIDFGSQFNQLMAGRVRERPKYGQIEPPTISSAHHKALNPVGGCF